VPLGHRLPRRHDGLVGLGMDWINQHSGH
jgi:hypothetical protein